MSFPVFKDRADRIINGWQDWANPEELYYWTEGRHEMELARAWFTSSAFEPDTPLCPPKLQALFATNTRTANMEIVEGYPNFITALPEGGQGTALDLMLRAYTRTERGVIGVAAKMEELFGEKIGDYWRRAKSYDHSDEPFRVSERTQALLEIVFGADARPERKPWCDLRYQLLAAAAETLLQAASEQVPLAVFVVHHFRTRSAKPETLKANAEDYERFVEVLFSSRAASGGQMYGPLQVQAGSYLSRPLELFVGKATSQVECRLRGLVAHQLVAEGYSEEAFDIILCEYEHLKSENLADWRFRYYARLLDSNWMRLNRGSDGNTLNRLRVVIERDLPDLWP